MYLLQQVAKGMQPAPYTARMLKITRVQQHEAVIFALSGRIEEAHVSELEQLLEGEQVPNVVLDLAEVKLVDRQVVKFLASCEARGIRLRNCPSYVREWLGKRSDQP
jgi:hypothetical protein